MKTSQVLAAIACGLPCISAIALALALMVAAAGFYDKNMLRQMFDILFMSMGASLVFVIAANLAEVVENRRK